MNTNAKMIVYQIGTLRADRTYRYEPAASSTQRIAVMTLVACVGTVSTGIAKKSPGSANRKLLCPSRGRKTNRTTASRANTLRAIGAFQLLISARSSTTGSPDGTVDGVSTTAVTSLSPPC